jgi:ribosomal protein S18 acetylase RimI-like enzyme
VKSETVRVASLADEDLVVDTIVLAFSADPMGRWAWPNAHQFLAALPRMVRALGGAAFSHQSAFCTLDHAGAALWLPPGVHPNEKALDALLQSTMSPSLAGETAAVFEQMATYHPKEPHWFLPLIGVDPAHQSEGHGRALMAYALERCDRDHASAYLESSNPRNIPFYERHGFESLGAIQVGSSPTVVPMLRGAR